MRILHTMLRVGNLERSIEFYTKVLGMRVLRSTEYPSGRFTNTFVGYEDENEGPVLELTYNWIPIPMTLALHTATSHSKLMMPMRHATRSAH